MVPCGESQMRQLLIGIVIVLLARFAMASFVLLVRFASESIPLGEILFFQNGVAFLCVLPFMAKFGVKSLKMESYRHLIVRIIFGFLGISFLTLSVKSIPVMDAILLNNAAPLYVPFVVLIWRKVPINHRLWAGIILGFIGLAMVLEPWKEGMSGSLIQVGTGVVCGLLSGMSLSVALVAMRILRNSRMFPILFLYYAVGIVVTAPFALMQWVWPSAEAWWLIIGIGVLTLITQGGYLKAFKYAKAAHLSPFFYVAVIYGALFDWIFFNLKPDFWMVFGTILLVVGGIWIILFSKHEVGRQ